MSRIPVTRIDRRTCCALLLGAMASPGCRWAPWSRRKDPNCPVDETGQFIVEMQQRFFIEEQRPLGMLAEPHPFVVELVAALNEQPHCQAYLIPENTTQLAAGGGAWQPPVIPGLTAEPGLFPARDVYLRVLVTEMVPYRPMRLSAMIETRTPETGYAAVVTQRTWDGPLDDEPLTPHHLDEPLFRKPKGLSKLERRDLSRISPRTFFKEVACELAEELDGEGRGQRKEES